MNFKFDKEHTFFTSDTHFNHANIIRFCNRPFRDVEQMNEALIANWNRVVAPTDTVFHLGDFCLGGAAEWTSVLDRLNGKIYLIMGNHDLKNFRQGFMGRFEHVSMQMHIEVGNQKIYLNHNPFLCYGGAYKDTWQLFGHVHSGPYNTGKDKPRLKMLFPMQYDVGVDNNEFAPVSFASVRDIINKQIKDAEDGVLKKREKTMGVDIALFMEVRHKGKWRPVIWQTPMELKSWRSDGDENKEWNTHRSFFIRRYYHFRDFIEEHAVNGMPKDVSPEFKKALAGWKCGIGYFSFSSLSHFCEMKKKEMLDHMSHSAEHQMIKQLNRIERYVKQKPITKTQMSDDSYYSTMSIKQIYEDYEDEFYLFDHVEHIISFLGWEGDILPSDDDIRILYGIC